VEAEKTFGQKGHTMEPQRPRRGRKGGGGKLSRSETVTVRLDPRLRYLAEVAARKQRRTVSSFIEWAVEEALSRVMLREEDPVLSVGGEGDMLWDVDEADRLIKLALRYPELLTHDEQVLWKLIKETSALWKAAAPGEEPNIFSWRVRLATLHCERLRESWDTFKAVAEGTAGRDALKAVAEGTAESLLTRDEARLAAGMEGIGIR
jgi:hypothetical protein